VAQVHLSFVIPVRDDATSLERCLASVRANLQEVTSEVVVADNGSTDRSAVVAAEAGARVLSLPGRRVSEARNAAAAAATGDLLAFVDADHELAPGWGRALVDVMRDPSTVAAGAPYHAPIPGTWVQRMYDKLRGHGSGIRPADWLGSGNLVVRRSAFDAIGGFDTSLETCEDVDLCQRLIARGGRLMAVDGMVSIHHGDPRTLKALFLGELWRGRDNLRVSLRAPMTLRAVPGLAVPLFTLVAVVTSLIGVVALVMGTPWFVLSGLAGVGALAVPLAVLLVSRTSRAERGLQLAFRALLFSLAYNVGRALALVARAGHRTRRAGAR
jgi:cellulose synthase/poly-beta-1,6-N-acetylglucosamine synthase-like glycosyltransferase